MTHKVVIKYERKRGCGYRFAGDEGVGIYLVGGGMREYCERLPHPLPESVNFSRGFTWVNPHRLFFPLDQEPACDPLVPHSHAACPMCNPLKISSQEGLLWAGDRYYTPDSFVRESLEMGISRRVNGIPNDFQFGVHFIFMAHIKAWPVVRWIEGTPITDLKPGVFQLFRPQRVELVIDDETDIPPKALDLKERFGDHAELVKIVRVEESDSDEISA